MINESLNKTKQINFSIVIPVHNEFNMLIQTLPSIFQLEAKEIIFVLDRCTDRTKELIEDFQSRFHFKRVDTRILSIEFKSQWNSHLNFLYDVGIKNARSEINLLSQADVLLDSERINNSGIRDTTVPRSIETPTIGATTSIIIP